MSNQLISTFFDAALTYINSFPETERPKQAAIIRRQIHQDITLRLTPIISSVDSVAIVYQLQAEPPYYSHKEIAQMLGISKQSVNQKLDQARKRGLPVLTKEEAMSFRAFVRDGIALPIIPVPRPQRVKVRTRCSKCGHTPTYWLFPEETEIFWSLLHQRTCPHCRRIGVMTRPYEDETDRK